MVGCARTSIVTLLQSNTCFRDAVSPPPPETLLKSCCCCKLVLSGAYCAVGMSCEALKSPTGCVTLMVHLLPRADAHDCCAHNILQQKSTGDVYRVWGSRASGFRVCLNPKPQNVDAPNHPTNKTVRRKGSESSHLFTSTNHEERVWG